LKAANATALFVTHDQMEAFAIGDVIGVMQEGHLAQWADAYHLYHRPASRFVAEFIGHGVFIPGVRQQVNGHLEVQTVLGLLIDEHQGNGHPSNEMIAFEDLACDVLLRADDIVHDDHAAVKAEIVRKAFRGSEFLYTLRLQSGDIVLAHVPSHHDHHLGEWIGIRAEVDHVVTFSQKNTL
jgi:iron(III) transport system ATP-binding protein